MSVRAAPARTRDAAPAIELPAKAPFRSLASVLEAGFRNLSLRDGAHTDVKRGHDGEPKVDRPVAGTLDVVIHNIRVEDPEEYGAYMKQTINFSVYRKGTGSDVFPGFPLDGPNTLVDLNELIYSGRLVGKFYKTKRKRDTVKMEFSRRVPFTEAITTMGPHNAVLRLPKNVPRKALRSVAQWKKGGTKLQDEDEAAFDLEEFLNMTAAAPVFHHLYEMVYDVYTALFDENQLAQQRKKLLVKGLRWPGARWSIGDPMDYDDDGRERPEEDESDDSDEGDGSDSEDMSDGSDESDGSDIEDGAAVIDVPNKIPRK